MGAILGVTKLKDVDEARLLEVPGDAGDGDGRPVTQQGKRKGSPCLLPQGSIDMSFFSFFVCLCLFDVMRFVMVGSKDLKIVHLHTHAYWRSSRSNINQFTVEKKMIVNILQCQCFPPVLYPGPRPAGPSI